MIPTRYINPGPMPAQASDAGQAAGRAIVAAGNALQNIGQTGMQIMGQVRRIKEQGEISAFMTNLDEEASQFSLELATRHDTENWPKDWQEKTTDMRERARGLGLSPEAMAKLDLDLNEWTTKRSIHFETQAATKALGMARAQLATSWDYYSARGDEEGMTRTMEQARSILDPAEMQKLEIERAKALATRDITLQIERDPQAVLDATEDQQAFLRNNPGATLGIVERARDEARTRLRRLTGEQTDAALDAIADGKVTDPADLAARFPNMRPMVRERLTDYMRDRQTTQRKAQLADPAYQARVFGEVSRRLSDYSPEIGDVDEALVEMKTLLYDLPESPMKTELLARMREKQTGATAAVTDRRTLALEALDTAAKSGRFGTVPPVEKVATRDAIRDGFLKDRAKLLRLGFDDDQASDIIEAAKKDIGEGQRQFSTLWKDRPMGAAKAAPEEIEAADAIRLGKPYTPWDSQESVAAAQAAQAAVDQRLGEAKVKFTNWLAANPSADSKAIDAKLIELGGEAVRKAYRESSTIPPRPTRPGTETSMLPKPLAPLAPVFQEAGQQYGIDPRVLMAISMHETGGGTSSAFRNKRNAMGVSDATGPISFEDPAESIQRMARVLSSEKGPYRNATTLAEIAAIYAPVGAGNDPRGLNKHWLAGVSKYLRQLGGDPSAPIRS